jgi:hypothetical protein
MPESEDDKLEEKEQTEDRDEPELETFTEFLLGSPLGGSLS